MNIFVTGGTGFVGGVLLTNLLKLGHHVYLLARNDAKVQGLLNQMETRYRSRIHVIYGDITQPDLHMRTDEINQLIGKIDVVYHMAALVKFDQQLNEQLYAINYVGTKHTLDFAARLGVKSFFYVSTAYSLGCKEEGVEELYPLDGPFQNPYEKTKCMAEHLVYSYQDKMDISIFRPAIIVGDSQTGKADSSFALYGFMRGLEVFKKRMDRRKSSDNKMYYIVGCAKGTSNIVPVDYVCSVLTIALARAKKNHVYHITNPDAPTNETILSLMKKHIGLRNVDVIHPSQSQSMSSEDLFLNELIGPFQKYLSRNIRFHDNNTRDLLQSAGEKPLHMDFSMLERIILGYNSEKEGIEHEDYVLSGT